MRSILTLGAILLATALSIPAQAAPADDLAARIDRACVAPLATPGSLSLTDHARAVESFAGRTDAYQNCLYGELNRNRAALSQSEQEVIAARLSRSSYALHAARTQYASALRAARLPMQVADNS
ncbi:hypothetical protein [Niveispirillum fermenti]|uniref:hypothetical protein n=1 Tax=Niveispirillum fermenti TaxID=1233113 RepID=UPI003A8BCCA3